MHSAEKFDVSTLTWVKGEIDETLKQARIALEAFVENSDDGAQLQSCISLLHQVAGTLQMVELSGAAKFASESEQLAIAFQNGEIADREHGLEALMRAILQLPDYLEALQTGGRDNPAILLPLLNDLRQVRGIALIDKREFFTPDLSVLPSEPPRYLGIDIKALARKLRPYFQAALLKLLRGEDTPLQLKIVETVFEKLYSVDCAPWLRQLQWVSRGFVEGLRSGALILDAESKQLLGKSDRLLKQITEGGDASLNDRQQLISAMLLRIVSAATDGPVARELRSAFRLGSLLPAADHTSQPLLGGFNAELKRTVSADILDELARVKETFDIYVRGDHRDVSGLTGIADSLGTMAETLVLLHQEDLSQQLRAQSSVLHRIVSGEAAPEDVTLMGVAGAILAVESSLGDWGNVNPLEKADDAAGQVASNEVGQLAEAEHGRVVRQVMKEARDGVIRIREAISQYLENPADKSSLSGVSTHLHEIVGSLTMLSYRRAAQVLRACGLFISNELEKGLTLPQPQKLDALADAIMSIEYYLEAFVQSRVHPASVLDVAEKGVAELGYAVDALPEGHERAGIDTEAYAEPVELTAPVEVPEVITSPMASTKPELAPSAPASPAATPAGMNPEVDEEILEIFIEESQEEVAKIGSLLPVWSSNPADEETLRDLRRCFHTLKGSGRLVGAAQLGEFAWAFENMLNRVIDGSVHPGPVMFDMLEQACEAFPQLIANFRDGTPLGDEIEMLSEGAREIVQPGGMQFTTEQAAAAPTTAAPPRQPDISQPRLELDPVLLDIYAKETEGHLDQVQIFIDAYRSGSHRVNEPLIRALHTLTGSSRMAGVMPVAEVSGPLEKYAKTLQVERLPLPEEGAALLEDCLDYTRQMLAHLQDGEHQPLPSNSELAKRAAALYETVKHAEESVAARPEEGLASVPEAMQSDFGAPRGPGASAETQPDALPSPATSSTLNAGSITAPADVSSYASDLEKAFEILDGGPPGSDGVELTLEPSAAQLVTPLAPVELPQAESLPHSEKVAPRIEEYDPELLEIFLEEGSDILNASEETLQAWVKSPDDRSLVELLQRQLHTLKGGARMAGINAIGDLSHSLESIFEAVVEGRVARSKRLMDLLQLAHDRLVVMLEQVRKHEPLSSGDDLISAIMQLGRGEAQLAPSPIQPLAPPTTTASIAAQPAPMMQAQPGIDPLEALLRTGGERIGLINANIAAWRRSQDDIALLHEIRHAAEALMQEAGTAVIVELTELAKAIADLLRAVNDGHVPVSEKMFTLLASSGERLALIFSQLTRRAALSNGLYLVTNISELIKSSLAELQAATAAARAETVVEPVTSEGLLQESKTETVEEGADNRRQGQRVQHEMVRVRADLLDNMVNFAGEVSIYRSRVEQQLGALRFNIDDLDTTVARLREQVRQFDIETEAQIDSRYREAVGQEYEEFDPLEFDRFTNMQQLSRSMMESLNDLLSIEEMMLNLSRESETLLLQQSRVNTELHETLMHTRMVPLVEHAPRLRRIVRQTCAELKKEASLSFKGAEVEMDRNVVERVLAPLEHMLRNSVAHGIESVEKRLAAGKAAEGSIVIALSREGSEVVIRVSDDGAGINLAAVRKKAIDRGLMAPDARLDDKEVMHFILESGFSTAESLSQIAGRGVGMDVVASEIKQLGGVLEIGSSAGKGTLFTIRLPLTLSVSRALLVYAGEDVYAVPLMSITGIERITKGELEQLLSTEQPRYRWVGQDYELMHLSRALGVTTQAPVLEGEKVSLLLAQSGDNRVALAVDGLVGSREIVVKSLGPQLSTLQDISGATILADGHVALIIDLPALIRRGLARRGAVKPVVERPEADMVPTVMVVDDSITVRKVTERLLKRHNMKCVTAKDGVDALSVLEDVTPDVMLLDIEMPRMDGYELATHIRNSSRFRDLPIIMITSRSGEKHRQRAMEIGVNVYMGKPYTEADLLDNIHQILQPTST
ncbi:MAG TPA: Hpt domain-containing protein [Gammaproteobacteria bacterium]